MRTASAAMLLTIATLLSSCEGLAHSLAVDLPEVGRAEPFQPPLPETAEVLEGALPLWHFPSRQVALVSLVVVFPFGAAEDPPGRAGLAALTAEMVDEGAGDRDMLALADEIDFLGAAVSVAADRESSTVALQVLRRNLEPALDLFADILLRPRFDESEWTRVKELWLNDLTQRRENPGLVARVVGDRRFFGDGHAYARPIDGFRADVEATSLDDVKAFHARWWRPDGAVVIAAGDVSTEELASLLRGRLRDWRGEGPRPEPARRTALATEGRPRVVAVDKPGAAQAVVRAIGPGIARSDPDYAALSLANVIFGGSFTSRLNRNLRETHGYTYGAGSDFSRLRGPGAFLSHSAVLRDVTGESITEFRREYRRMATGEVTAEELERARATINQKVVEGLETLGGTVRLFAGLVRNGLPAEEARKFVAEIRRTDAAAVAAAARKHIDWDAATLVLVGDLATIREEISGLDLGEPLIVDEDGNADLTPR